MKRIAILGSTGSIGRQTLDVIRQYPDKFKAIALAANSNIEKLAEQSREFNVGAVAVAEENNAQTIGRRFKNVAESSVMKIFYGKNSLVELVQLDEIDIVVVAVTGAAGILPTLKAIEAGKQISLANKETLVVAGDLVNAALKGTSKSDPTSYKASDRLRTFRDLSMEDFCVSPRRNSISKDSDEAVAKSQLLPPIDSEHSAIFQCLIGEDKKNINKIILTCSGGSFRDYSLEQLANVTVKDALKHPTWKMGSKITIDCATLMNKGFEVIEAHQLFGIAYEKIEVVIHPESKVHSMVEFIDGSIKAQLGASDMRLPIQYSISYPERLENNFERLEFSGDIAFNLFLKRNKNIPLFFKGGDGGGRVFTFYQPDFKKFPCLNLAINAGKIGGTMPAALNAANEICVRKFLNNKIKFLDIAEIIKQVMCEHHVISKPTLEQILKIDRWARERAQAIIAKRSF